MDLIDKYLKLSERPIKFNGPGRPIFSYFIVLPTSLCKRWQHFVSINDFILRRYSLFPDFTILDLLFGR